MRGGGTVSDRVCSLPAALPHATGTGATAATGQDIATDEHSANARDKQSVDYFQFLPL